MFRYISERAQLLRAYSSGIGKPLIIYPGAFLCLLAATYVAGAAAALPRGAGAPHQAALPGVGGALRLVPGIGRGDGRIPHFRARPMFAGQALGVCVFALLAWMRHPFMLGLLLALLGIAGGMSYSASIFHGASGAANRHRRMALHEAILASGLVLGAAFGGTLYGRTSLTHVYLACALIIAVGMAVQAVLCKGIDSPAA